MLKVDEVIAALRLCLADLPDKDVGRQASALLEQIDFVTLSSGFHLMGVKLIARPIYEWNHEDSSVVWWKFPIDEPPYIGTPDDTDWPGYHTHWTPLADAALP